MWRTGSTLPLPVYSTSRGLRIRTHQAERAFLFAALLQGFPKLRNLRLEAGGAKSSTGRPMIFSRGSPKSLPAPMLASLVLPSSSAIRMGAEG